MICYTDEKDGNAQQNKVSILEPQDYWNILSNNILFLDIYDKMNIMFVI